MIRTSKIRRSLHALRHLRHGILFLLVLFAFVLPAARSQEVPSPQPTPTEENAATIPILLATDTQALLEMEGQKITVIGKCNRTGKSNGGTNFVNFENAEFTLVAFKSDLAPFTKGEPADIYRGRFLSVTGILDVYRDSPQIKLLDPGQVEVSDKAFALPEPDAAPDAGNRATGANARGDKGDAGQAPNTDDPTAPAEEEKPKPPVDPRKYFKKPTGD